MRHPLSGYICVRNALRLDYPVLLAAESLLPVVDELVLSDGESDDGTRELLEEFAAQHSGVVRLHDYAWGNPVRDLGWWVRWLNVVREQLRGEMQLTLDADEVLDPCGHERVRAVAAAGECAFFERANYWRSPEWLAPDNRCCGKMVARLGPRELYMPSDEPFPDVEPNVRTTAREWPELHIHHLGFLRRPEAFVAKSRVVQTAFFGSVDARLLEVEARGEDWRERDYFDGLPLEPARRPVPEMIHPWLRERGYRILP